jgi:hypothetical protein
MLLGDFATMSVFGNFVDLNATEGTLKGSAL